jgi:single-strand DNA-binding protein
MNNLNQIYLLGNLTRDPEIKYTNEGTAITELGIAVNKKWKDSSGEDMEAVDFFNVTAWNSLAENCANTLKKGDRVLISGHLNLRSWENKEGKKFNIININADVISASLEFCNIKIAEKNNKKIKKEIRKESGNNMEEENFIS